MTSGSAGAWPRADQDPTDSGAASAAAVLLATARAGGGAWPPVPDLEGTQNPLATQLGELAMPPPATLSIVGAPSSVAFPAQGAPIVAPQPSRTGFALPPMLSDQAEDSDLQLRAEVLRQSAELGRKDAEITRLQAENRTLREIVIAAAQGGASAKPQLPPQVEIPQPMMPQPVLPQAALSQPSPPIAPVPQYAKPPPMQLSQSVAQASQQTALQAHAQTHLVQQCAQPPHQELQAWQPHSAQLYQASPPLPLPAPPGTAAMLYMETMHMAPVDQTSQVFAPPTYMAIAPPSYPGLAPSHITQPPLEQMTKWKWATVPTPSGVESRCSPMVSTAPVGLPPMRPAYASGAPDAYDSSKPKKRSIDEILEADAARIAAARERNEELVAKVALGKRINHQKLTASIALHRGKRGLWAPVVKPMEPDHGNADAA